MKSMLWINNIYNRKGLLDLPLEFIYEISGYLNKKIRKNSKDKYHKEKNTSRKFYKLHYISIQRNANGVSPRHHFYVLNSLLFCIYLQCFTFFSGKSWVINFPIQGTKTLDMRSFYLSCIGSLSLCESVSRSVVSNSLWPHGL